MKNSKKFINYYFSKKIVAIIIVLAVVIISCVYNKFIKTPMYESNTLIAIAGSEVTDSNKINTNSSQNLMPTFCSLVKSRRILNETIQELQLKTNVKELEKKVKVFNEKNTQLITITVEDSNNNQAKEIANKRKNCILF